VTRWKFGDFVMDLGTRELGRENRPVALSPKAFELLGLLIANAPRAVSKADIQERLWPDTFVVEKNVTNLVSEIRAALGDDPARPGFVRTVPRFGYAFAGELAAEPRLQPASAAEWPGHNLPGTLTSFVGRDEAIAELTALLTSTRLLTLTGAGGCGKTRLAIELARLMIDRFRNGIWMADLAPLSEPASIAQAVAGLFDVRQEADRPLAISIATALRHQHTLLILDNCEHAIEACAALAQTLLDAAPQLTILATSREPLLIAGEAVRRVPPLSMPDEADGAGGPPEGLVRHGAIRLFLERARAVDETFALTSGNAAALVEICRRLDGIPLAIELAAARLRVLSMEQVRDRLHDRFTLLTGGSRTAVARQRTLEATLDWSYNLAAEPERRLLQRLAAFARGCTIDAAEDVCAGAGIEREDVLELVSRLADKSLVTVEVGPDGRRQYRLLETVRDYARERLLESGDAERVRDRHLDVCVVQTARAAEGLAGSDQVLWLRRLFHEYDNLRAALDWSLTSPARARRGLELATGLILFWMIRGAFAEGQRWLERLLAANPAADRAPRARALLGLGQMMFFQGRFERACAVLEQSAGLARETEDEASVVLALGFHALALMELGEPARGVPLAEEALALRGAASPPWVHGPALSFLAYQALDQEDYDLAARRYEEVLALGRASGHQWGIAIALVDLALLRVVQARHEDARTLCGDAVQLFQELGDRWGVALCLGILAGAEAAKGQPLRAARLYGTMQQVLDSMSAPVQASFNRWIGDRYLTAGERAIGTRLWRAALAEGHTMSLPQAVAYAFEGSPP
jgi:non-specific serine/threonine protein kinase